MLRNLLLALLFSFSIASLSFAQVTCPGGLTVEIEGSTEGTPLSVTGVETQPNCNNESGDLTGGIIITPDGGNLPYTFQWTFDGANFSTEQNLEELGTGTYAVTVTDAQLCIATGEWVITEPTPVVVTGTPVNLNCNSASGDPTGSITLEASGGTEAGDYTYNWESSTGGLGLDPSAQNQTELTAGTYEVTVTDDLGCTATNQFTLTEPAAIATIATAVPPQCHADSGDPDGSITLLLSGGDGNYSFNWETTDGSGIVTTEQNQSNLSAGTYNVTISDGLGCTLEAEYVLGQPTPVAIDATPVNLDCHSESGDADGSITITASGGQGSSEGDYTYNWETTDGSGLVAGVASQTGLSAGTYSLTVTDGNLCTAVGEWELTEPAAIIADGTPVNLDCHSDSGDPTGSITMNPAGGDGNYSYAWETTDGSGLAAGAGTQTGLSAGTYNVTVTDGLGCSEEAEFTLTEPAAIIADGTPVNPGCNAASGSADGTITMDPAGGDGNYSYAWETTDGSGLTPGQGTQTGLSAGTYNVTVTDGLGCSEEAQFVLAEPAAVTCSLDSPQLGENTTVDCYEDTAVITVTAGGGTGAYTYTLNGTDYDGNTVSIGPQSEPTFTVSAGNYTVTTADVNGCSTTCDIEITQPDPLIAGTCTTDDECQVGTGEIVVEVAGGVGPYTVTWTSDDGGTLDQASQIVPLGGGSVVFTGADGGSTYIFTIEDENGCTIGGN